MNDDNYEYLMMLMMMLNKW